jgi:PPM family protein phosphatase
MHEKIAIDSRGMSHVGNVRKRNEDAFLVAGLNKALSIYHSSLPLEDETTLTSEMQGQLFVVADGMGGQAAGDRASRVTIETISSFMLNTMPWFFSIPDRDEAELRTHLTEALERCRRALHREGEENPERNTMGTTLTMAYLLWPALYVVHAGDSRCYVLRDDQLHRITRDHTVAERLAEEGAIESEEITSSPFSEVIWNAVSADESTELSPEAHKLQLDLHDTLLLCSDGLNKHVSDERVAEILGAAPSAESACRSLIDAANDDGGTDNTTVIVTRFGPEIID